MSCIVRDGNVRMLVNEAACVVDLVVYDKHEILLGVVGRDLVIGELLAVCHCVCLLGGI